MLSLLSRKWKLLSRAASRSVNCCPSMEQDGVTEQRASSALRRKNKASRKPMRAVAETVLEMGQIA